VLLPRALVESALLPRASVEIERLGADVADGRARQASHAVILVVDDDDAVRETTAAIIREMGYGVVDAASGEAALEILSRGDSINALLTDVVMPGINGIELAQKALGLMPGLPVVYISGFAEPAGIIGSSVSRRLVKKPSALPISESRSRRR
jgi:CheY-like chemotaxis protein